jgi:hypothetical protein
MAARHHHNRKRLYFGKFKTFTLKTLNFYVIIARSLNVNFQYHRLVFIFIWSKEEENNF